MLSIQNLSVRYENKLALQNVSIDFDKGKISGLIGPNGAGKSTLLKSCVGVIGEFSGKIFYNGKDLKKNRHWVKEHCGYAPEDTVLLPYLKGKEFLELIGTLRKSNKLAQEIEILFDLLKLKGMENELILNYSHGMRKKISIASALIGNPDYLIIDEAMNGLDSVSLFNLKKHLLELARSGKTILISSHILALILEWCDPIVIMHEGTIVKSYAKNEINTLEMKTQKSFEEIFIDMVEKS